MNRKTLLSFFGIVILNALIAYPLLFQVYKHFNLKQNPMEDIGIHLRMVESGPLSAQPPFRFRLITPAAVKVMRVLPGYGVPIDFTEDPAVRKDFFHFLLLNFCLTMLVSGLLFVYLRRYVPPVFAWMGTIFYCFSFNLFMANYLPLSDPACHLAIIVAILCFETRRPVGLLLACLIGVFAKETVLVVLIPWIAVHSIGDRKRLAYLLCTLPALAVYIAMTQMFPAHSKYMYYNPSSVLNLGYFVKNAFLFLNPSLYTRTFLFHVGLANLPFAAALAAYAWLRLVLKVKVPLNRGLWVYFWLLWFALAIGSGLQTGRIAFMVFPAVTLFMARVVQAVCVAAEKRPGLAAPA